MSFQHSDTLNLDKKKSDALVVDKDSANLLYYREIKNSVADNNKKENTIDEKGRRVGGEQMRKSV